jgi:tRNA(His) 5'-end guanylyltransferase
MPQKDDLGDRMKKYEDAYRFYMTPRNVKVLRIDGKAFHTFTKGFYKPYDELLSSAMKQTMVDLCSRIQGAKLGYTQSDEISILLIDYENMKSDSWFDGNLQKTVSVAASYATFYFNKAFQKFTQFCKDGLLSSEKAGTKTRDFERERVSFLDNVIENREACFDARAFLLPKEEVSNYFLWRSLDCYRNAVESAAHANFKQKELNKLNCNQLQEKLFTEKGINFNDYPTWFKRGTCTFRKEIKINEGTETEAIRHKWILDEDIPIFTKDRNYIEQFVYINGESQ